ncbi:MAG: farnesyl diphosphate synthase [Pseudomonadota bacterium]|nr:farnesyl diphosphate synthase [Pseudomonadota bacterium]
MDRLKVTEEQLSFLSQRVESALERWLPRENIHPASLHEAMRYSVLNGGKRIRPALMYATGMALGVPLKSLDGAAAAVELIHAYSLIHDDLPAMDDDDLRRGKPTCHKAFDEASAILAGDAIQALAFNIIASDPEGPVSATIRLKMIEVLAHAAGSRGMAGGQAIDLASVGMALSLTELEDMHIHKTGALIRTSVMLAAHAKPGIETDTLGRLDHFSKCIGLAFQIHDDVLDVEGDTEILGKPQGSDRDLNKPTYPAILGLAESRVRALDLYNDATDSLSGLGDDASLLKDIAAFIVTRES